MARGFKILESLCVPSEFVESYLRILRLELLDVSGTVVKGTSMLLREPVLGAESMFASARNGTKLEFLLTTFLGTSIWVLHFGGRFLVDGGFLWRFHYLAEIM